MSWNSKPHNDVTDSAWCHSTVKFTPRTYFCLPLSLHSGVKRVWKVCVCVYSGNLPSLLMALVYTGNIETPLGWNFSLMAKCCLSSARLVAWLLLLVFKMTMLRTPDALEYGCVVYKFKFLPVWIVGSCWRVVHLPQWSSWNINSLAEPRISSSITDQKRSLWFPART